MRKTIVCLISILIPLLLWSQSENSPIAEKMLLPEELKEDFRIFRGVLEEIHPGLYRHRSKEEMNLYFENIEAGLVPGQSLMGFYRKILHAVSKVGCGHTWAEVSGPLDDYLRHSSQKFPFWVKIIGGKLYCYKSISKGTEDVIEGREIVSINGHPSETIIKRFMGHAVADGTAETGRLRWIERKFGFYYVLMYGSPTD